jgi:hypothetical protein
MGNTRHALFWMGVYLAIVVGVCILLVGTLKTAFLASWGFNSLILTVLMVGVFVNFRQVMVLQVEIDWIKLFRTGESGLSVATEPHLLKPLARHISGLRKDRFRLSALSLRTILDGIHERLDESREISHYITSTLIFLGLLGTFWGLLGTISAVGQVINGLDVGSSNDLAGIFSNLKMGLQRPLNGMGTAFSSSLFGLGGSLVLGFLDIQASHAQNRFFNGLEEWLSGVTQLLDTPGNKNTAVPDDLLEDVVIPPNDAIAMLVSELQAERQLLKQLLHERFPDKISPTGE